MWMNRSLISLNGELSLKEETELKWDSKEVEERIAANNSVQGTLSILQRKRRSSANEEKESSYR